MSDKSTSDENGTILDRNSENSARRHREAKNSDSDRRRDRKSGEERTLMSSASRGSEKSGKDMSTVEGNETPKMDMNKTVRSDRPVKKSSIFDVQDDDDVFQKKTPKNARPVDSGQEAKKIQNRRSSRVFERKRKSTQTGTDDEIDGEGKKRRTQANEQSRRRSDRQSTSSQMNQTENRDDSQNIETDEEEVSDTEAQEKVRIAARSRSAHNEKILRIINHGSEAQLKSLSRIGPKTATMLHQYRKLHGRFTSIDGLEDMPGWTPKVFEQFLKANNIILD